MKRHTIVAGVLVAVFAAAVGAVCSVIWFYIVRELLGIAIEFQFIKDELSEKR